MWWCGACLQSQLLGRLRQEEHKFDEVILAIWEAEIGRIKVGGQPRQKF
jgi:hypothetical protein